ncbi:hypothetical protein OU426_16760 [Frigidibacter sp. RF13]|uniref:hypothetical protein n=1 Tax=Frigidibacter sp. RF13 TaxID=2997340 RepID=UPI00226F089F|nr:hypothetical protein [Frigidibacter sp. RF13]MCY1128516.1 hypothetical protein [Frigidibacter sp. RF13]
MANLARAVALAALMSGSAASAESNAETLFTHKDWQVQVVGWDDGSFSCMAQVSTGDKSFSMWADAKASVEIQFYDSGWDLGEGGTANLVVQIDSLPTWTLNNASMLKQSVFFTLPDGDDGMTFISEVMRGNGLYLGNDKGEAVESYSLAGSSASIKVFIDCITALQQG